MKGRSEGLPKNCFREPGASYGMMTAANGAVAACGVSQGQDRKRPLSFGNLIEPRFPLTLGRTGVENLRRSLETKNRFFPSPTVRWRPYAVTGWKIEAGTGRVRCRSYPFCSLEDLAMRTYDFCPFVFDHRFRPPFRPR
jgi:hypothetical protein